MADNFYFFSVEIIFISMAKLLFKVINAKRKKYIPFEMTSVYTISKQIICNDIIYFPVGCLNKVGNDIKSIM